MTAYKLLIVDDEREVREGVKDVCSEIGLNLECAGLCENGLEAYRFLLSQPVDIVLSDIRMPFLDGIELVERVSQQFPFTKVVFLSGYNEFDYVKKGLQLGIVDYLLKPVDENELESVIGKITKQLDDKRQAEYKQETMNRRAKLSARLLRKYFLKQLLDRPLSADTVEEGCAVGEIILESDWYSVCTLRLERFEELNQRSEKERQLVLFALENMLTELWDDAGLGYHYTVNESGLAYLLAVSQSEENLPELFHKGLEDRLNRIHKEFFRLRGLFRTTITITAGMKVSDHHALSLSREDSERVFSLMDSKANKMVALSTTQSHFPKPSFIEVMPEHVYPHAPEMDNSHKLVDDAKSYILNNYDRSLSLVDVADFVHMSAGYLSHLFKQVTGVNFIQFLTDCRIEAAKRLLVETDFKIYEVGERVGYEIPRYFSDIFKKATGKTPLEYRLHHFPEG
ncbi:response regulator [Paenibacillus aestuarii]|uniref:Response regulator n=1 Tax=Paenibacillus aestuarii TaxID=516965 RepID=A0ABW0KH61_9BACL|nr:response regulator [Paenibacillus aestuarii]